MAELQPNERVLTRPICALFHNVSCETCIMTVVVVAQLTSMKIRCADSGANNQTSSAPTDPVPEVRPVTVVLPPVIPRRARRPVQRYLSVSAPVAEPEGADMESTLDGINISDHGTNSREPKNSQISQEDGETLIEASLPVVTENDSERINPSMSESAEEDGMALSDSPPQSEVEDDLVEGTDLDPEDDIQDELTVSRSGTLGLNPSDVPQDDDAHSSELREGAPRKTDLVVADKGRKASTWKFLWVLLLVMVTTLFVLLCFCCCCCTLVGTRSGASSTVTKTGSWRSHHTSKTQDLSQGHEEHPASPPNLANAEFLRAELLNRAARYGFASAALYKHDQSNALL